VLHRSPFQTCAGDAYCGVDRKSIRSDADHGRSLSSRTSDECGLSDFETHYPHFHLSFPFARRNRSSCPIHTPYRSRYNRIIMRLMDASSLPTSLSVYRFPADIQTSVHDRSLIHPHFIILSSHTVVFSSPGTSMQICFLIAIVLPFSRPGSLGVRTSGLGTLTCDRLVLDAACTKVAIPGVS
jgi:hypothetical protein